MALGDTLKRKAGPLPVWAWSAIGVAFLAAIMIMRQRKAAAAAAANSQNSTGTPAATNLGSNTLSNLVPTAYPMPFQQGDVFVTTQVPAPTSGGTTTTTPPPGTTTTQPTSYVIAKGDTWDSIGKKLNVAPILLWESNGAPAGFTVPKLGTQINIRGLVGNPSDVYANQAKIIAAEGAIAKSGTPAAPKPGTVING